MDVVTSFPAYFAGFVHTLPVFPTYIYVAVIALFFGLAAERVGGVLFLPVLSAVVFVAALAVIPPLLANGDITVPAFDLDLAKKLVAAYAVFLVLGAVVFAVKKVLVAILDR